MARRQRIDSAAAAVAVASAATTERKPPAHVPLEKRDMPFWKSVIAEFARSEWSDHSLELAAMLARDMSDYASEQMLLRSESRVMASDRGTPVINPRCTVVQTIASRITSMRRSLSLHARAQKGEARDVGKRGAVAREIEDGVRAGFDDGLLAGGSIQ